MNDAEMGWYVRSRGRVLGPFQPPQLEVLKNQGRLARFDELSRDRRTWVRAASVPELFPPAPAAGGVTPSPEATTESDRSLESTYAMPDSGAVANETTSWFYLSEQGQTGPVVMSDLIQLAQLGIIQAETSVWNSGLTDWIPARQVPALGLTAADLTAAPAAAPVSAGLNAFSLAGFILGIVGLTAAGMAVLTSLLVSARDRDSDILGLVFLGFAGSWGISSTLATILSPIGIVRARRAGGERRGFGLGLTGMILGIVGLVGLLCLILLAAFGIIVSAGNTQSS